jgi:glycosyltransferase involved in cell wall biosynthesis
MIRIVYVIPSLSVGGTEWQLIYLVRGLAKDHEMSIICTRHDGALAGDARRAGAYVRVVGSRFGGWDFTITRKLARMFRGFRPDVVHLFMFGFDLWPALAARQAGVPVVVSSRRQLATWQKRRHVWIQRKANKLVDCIVANSRAVAEFAMKQEGADAGLLRIIPNGVCADEFVSNVELRQARRRYGIPLNTHVIGIVANFTPVKDYPVFVNMAQALLRRRTDLHFLMVGAGPDVSQIERLIEKRGLRDYFTRISTISERPDLYALMDVFVLCSREEGFPNALIEAMAAGRPVVVAARGGMLEAVSEGVTGRLVQSRAPEDFADAVAWVLDHPADSRRMAAQAAQYVREELTMEAMVARYRALYAELLAGKRRKGR